MFIVAHYKLCAFFCSQKQLFVRVMYTTVKYVHCSLHTAVHVQVITNIFCSIEYLYLAYLHIIIKNNYL